MRFTHIFTLSVLSATMMANAVLAKQTEADVYYYDLSDQFVANLANCIKAESLRKGIKVKEFNAAGDQLTQSTQMEEDPKTGATLLVNLVDPAQADQVVEKAKKNSQRVIFFNREPSSTVLESYDDAWYVGADPVQAGDYQAELVIDYIRTHPEIDRNKDGKISIVFLKGEKNHQETASRTQAVIRELEQNKIAYEITFESYTNWSFNQGYDYMAAQLTQKGIDKTELLIGNNDSLILGAIQALADYGYNQGNPQKVIPAFGIDAIPEALTAITAGNMSGTVLNDASAMAKAILGIAAAESKDPEEIEKSIGYFISDDHRVLIPYIKVSHRGTK
ncbi:MAG: galactose ABC transporter substrate-binding protein [Succinivibrio sp.]|nr:galactose ABC transporter substrate-binding protein [Succinivibrio sp.]